MAFNGFGSANNNNNRGFGGGFGSSTGGGFGTNNNTTTGGSMFGGNTATSGGFGGGFGSNNNTTNNNPFNTNKSSFGASTSGTGSMFGSGSTTTGGFGTSGGFGSSANATGGFGTNNTGSIFGQNKPATGGFGSTNTGTSMFGGGGNTSGSFGSNNNTAGPFGTTATNAGFGATNNSTFGGGFGSAAATSTANNGTAAPPFTEFLEKDNVQNQMQHFQSITMVHPYTTSNFEELRLQDYAQGRRFAANNGQAGSFGTSTPFGGFNSSANNGNTSGIFGTNANNNPGFGNTGGFGSTNNNSPFGATNNNSNNNSTTGSMFGAIQNKPTGGSMFGGNATGTSTGGFGSTNTNTGSMFGNNNNNNNTSFGSNANTNTGGGLFANNAANQNKSAFGGFGTAPNTNTSFGSGGSVFGNNNNNAANAATGGSLFGANNAQPSNTGFGASNTGTSPFGNQNKPAATGMFGSNTNTGTGGSLFGNQNNAQQQNPGFGASNTGGSLFGNQNKPQGASLFAGGTNNNTGGSLFGSTNNAQPAGNSLFGGNNNAAGTNLFGNQNKPANSLFGANAASNTGNSLFGSQNNQGGSMFGNNSGQNQNNNTSSLFGSMNQNPQPAQNQLHASLTISPYGNEQLFASLAAPSPPIGPLATPLNGAKPVPKKTQSLLASVKVGTPVYSPRGGSLGRASGYGFSYSTYGTPGSAYTSGSLTPGASSLLKPTNSFSSTLSARLNKSLSTSNLRGDSAPDTPSLLRPGSFTPGSRSGSLRRLKIDRTLRTDLWGPEPKQIESAKESSGPALRKKVSFTDETEKTAVAEPSAQNALVRTEDNDASSPLAEPSSAKSAAAKAPEMEQVKSLSTVHEDTETPRATPAAVSKQAPASTTSISGEAGEYWTKPAMKDLKHMSRQQLQNVGNFVVGRTGVGRIEFGRVDLTNTNLDDICGTIVQLSPRSATVYQDDHDKPSVGKALNVPSTIYLENSWPRSNGGRKSITTKSGREYDKHIARLRRVGGTHFLAYEPDTGVWSFKVDHFTTYGLDDDDDDETDYMEDSDANRDSSSLSEPPETPTGHEDLTLGSMDEAEQDDTFHFKKIGRSQISLPGNFGSEGVMMDDVDTSFADPINEEFSGQESFTNQEMEDPFITSSNAGGPVQPPSPNAIERYTSSVAEDDDEGEVNHSIAAAEEDVPGSFGHKPPMPRSILKASTDLLTFASPEHQVTDAWADVLQRTMSPVKRDRQALRNIQSSTLPLAPADNKATHNSFKMSILGKSALAGSYLVEKSAKKAVSGQNRASQPEKSQAFRTAMDLMDSMYSKETTGRKEGAAAKGFEFPYNKKPRLSTSADPNSLALHGNFKPHFATSAGILAYAATGAAPQPAGVLTNALTPVISAHEDVRFAKFARAVDMNSYVLQVQKDVTLIEEQSGFPFASLAADTTCGMFSNAAKPPESPSESINEKQIWQLCSILFDDFETGCNLQVVAVPREQREGLQSQIHLDALRDFFAQLTYERVQSSLKRAKTAEERALLLLTAGDVEGACDQLIQARDFKLATLISQLPGNDHSRALMQKQIRVWCDRNDWAEMSDPIRALYSILAGEVFVVAGKAGAKEDRIGAFNIASAFGLTWQQSFMLVLSFGGHESIAQVYQAFEASLKDEKSIKPVKELADGSRATDVMFELIRLAVTGTQQASLFDPRIISGSATNTRLTWQLATVLHDLEACVLSPDVYDTLAVDFASELEAAEKPVTSAWVLLHIRDAAARERAVSSMLHRNGGRISTPGLINEAAEPIAASDSFEHLTVDLKIPAAMVFKAKALWAQAGLQNPFLQTNFLLRAGEAEEAHEILLSSVGPTCIIERDYDTLRATLDIFDTPTLRPSNWDIGGHVYVDFLRIVHAQQTGKTNERGLPSAMQRLKRNLPKMRLDAGKISLEERVALVEMDRTLLQFERLVEGPGMRDVEMSGGVESGVLSGGFESGLLGRYRQAMGVVV